MKTPVLCKTGVFMWHRDFRLKRPANANRPRSGPVQSTQCACDQSSLLEDELDELLLEELEELFEFELEELLLDEFEFELEELLLDEFEFELDELLPDEFEFELDELLLDEFELEFELLDPPRLPFLPFRCLALKSISFTSSPAAAPVRNAGRLNVTVPACTIAGATAVAVITAAVIRVFKSVIGLSFQCGLGRVARTKTTPQRPFYSDELCFPADLFPTLHNPLAYQRKCRPEQPGGTVGWQGLPFSGSTHLRWPPSLPRRS